MTNVPNRATLQPVYGAKVLSIVFILETLCYAPYVRTQRVSLFSFYTKFLYNSNFIQSAHCEQ